MIHSHLRLVHTSSSNYPPIYIQVFLMQGRTQGAWVPACTSPIQTRKLKTGFVDTMMSKGLRDLPFSRNRLMTSALKF